MVFATYGEVNYVHLMNKAALSGARCAFVFYTKYEAAENAVKMLNNVYKIRETSEQAVIVKWARDGARNMNAPGSDWTNQQSSGGWAKGGGCGGPPPLAAADPQLSQFDGHKLFVGGLPPACSEEEIKMVFGTYGTVKKVVMMNKAQETTGLRSCFVFYEKQEAADDAIKLLNGVYKIREDAEQPIKVSWAKPRTGPWNANAAQGVGWQGKGGPVNQPGQNWNSFAPSQYSSNGGGVNNWAGCGGSSAPWQAGGAQQCGTFGEMNGCAGGGLDAAGTQLYVSNLPEDIQQDALEYVFGTYGKVNRVHIMNQKSVNGRVAAFVYYHAKEDAESAIGALNEKYEIRPGYGFIQVKHASAKPRSSPY